MRHVLTIRERIRGIERALANRKTPAHLRPGLQVHLRELEKRLRRGGVDAVRRKRRARLKRPLGLLDWLGF